MRFSFRRPAAPASPALPSKDQVIADLSKENVRLRGELTTANNIVVYQNMRMREMAAEILGSQATIARYQTVAETWTAVDRALAQPDKPSDEGVIPHECRHATVKHGQWGCWAPGCDCTIPRHMLDKAVA